MNNDNDPLTQLYGTGWQFPVSFSTPAMGNHAESSLQMSAGSDNVRQSLKLLFSTQPGERMMLPSWGCDLQSSMFASLAEGPLAALQTRIAEGVARYEPRAENVAVRVEKDSTQHSTLNITVTYHLSGQSRQISGQLNVLEGGGTAWAI